MIRNLAQQIEALRSGTHPGAASSGQNAGSEPTPAENSPPVMMEMEDLRQKVTRFIEQVDQNNGELGNLRCALPRLDLIEDQNQRGKIGVRGQSRKKNPRELFIVWGVT